MSKTIKHVTRALSAAIATLAITGGMSTVHAKGGHGFAHGYGYGKPTSYTLQGDCAFLPADRATEFHGNPDTSKLNLGMAGNQWVVFKEAMQVFNVWMGTGNGTEPEHRPNVAGSGWNLADLNEEANRYFIELIPPGQIRKQIKSGCMLLGNDEERNFLPNNFQVDFDVFASTNYNLMQDLANNGFIDEAVPYIANRLDLMVAADNLKSIGSDSYTGDPEFDTQFDIAMDLLSGDVVASSLDHINEGIHNASNGYMKKVDAYINSHAEASTPITMTYRFGNDDLNVPVTATMTAVEWLEAALQAVRVPHPDSPGYKRLPGSGDPLAGDAGENHTSHNLEDNDCGTVADLKFCEFAVLNKFNTHESRVHHVETPGGVVGDPDFVPVDVGYVWITELAYQINQGNSGVTGMSGNVIADGLGIPNTDGVNADKIYSLALLATSKNKWRGRMFIDFLRSPEGQAVYTAGGFTGLTPDQLDGGKCYAKPDDSLVPPSTPTTRTGDSSCDDWLHNN
jgi:hypothetical protein